MTEPIIKPENLKFQIEKPFGPSIGRCKLPQELIDDFNKDCDGIIADKEKSKLHDYSDSLVGNVKQELLISPKIFTKWVPYFKKLITAYIRAHTENVSEFQRIKFQSAWYVRSFAGDFNPAHYHTNCHMSCVGYLSLPKGIKKEWEQEDRDHHPSAGSIEMQYGQFQLFSNHTVRMRPEVGDFFLFPWWMYHMVYPFRTKGERRSFSFNTELETDSKQVAAELKGYSKQVAAELKGSTKLK